MKFRTPPLPPASELTACASLRAWNGVILATLRPKKRCERISSEGKGGSDSKVTAGAVGVPDIRIRVVMLELLFSAVTLNSGVGGIEPLNEILLRMSYDVNKTLSENIIIITEQMAPKGPYYTPAGELTDKPGRFTSPTTTTNIAASRVYPEIKDNKYPKKADFNKLNLAFTGRRLGTLSQQSSKIPTQKSSSFTPPDTRSYQDATYVSPQNLMGSGPPKPKDVPTFNTPNNVTYQDATYVSPQYAGIKDPELIKIAKKWEEEKESTRPIPPKSEVIMYDPNQYPKPTPKWIYKGVKYTNKKDADSKYEIDKKEWIKKYGEGFEQWVATNGDTIHTILGYGALALAIVSMAAATVLTGGLALPAVGLSLEGVAGAASLLLTAADSGLYAYARSYNMYLSFDGHDSLYTHYIRKQINILPEGDRFSCRVYRNYYYKDCYVYDFFLRNRFPDDTTIVLIHFFL